MYMKYKSNENTRNGQKWTTRIILHYKAPIQKCYDWSGTKWLCFDVMEKSL